MATKACIACAEQIQDSAKLCRYCNVLQNDTRFIEHNPVVPVVAETYSKVISNSDQDTLESVSSSHATITTCKSCYAQNDKTAYRCLDCDAWLDHSHFVPAIGGRWESENQNRAYSKPAPGRPLEATPGIAIAAIIVAFLIPILGLILGYSARSEIRNPHRPKEGDSLATGAIVIGWIWILAGLTWLVIVLIAAVGAASHTS